MWAGLQDGRLKDRFIGGDISRIQSGPVTGRCTITCTATKPRHNASATASQLVLNPRVVPT